MKSIVLSFIRRAVIVPVLITAVVTAVIYFALPKFLNDSDEGKSAYTVTSLDLSPYNVNQYDAFSELEKNDFVGSVYSEKLGFGESAVLFDCDGEHISLDKDSAEPWNSGGVILYGDDSSSQFGNLENAEIGDEITVKFYSNEEYTYTVTDIKANLRYDEVKKYAADNTLIAAISYNDFSNLGEDYLYTIYIAE